MNSFSVVQLVSRIMDICAFLQTKVQKCVKDFVLCYSMSFLFKQEQ